MKFGLVSRRTLYIVAALLWLVAGSNVALIGYKAWPQATGEHLYWLVGAWLFFYFGIFPRVVARNISALEQSERELHPLYRCFTPSSWFVMLFMISLGVGLRYSGWVGANFIAGFYTGLGLSLIGAIRFYIHIIISSGRRRSGTN